MQITTRQIAVAAIMIAVVILLTLPPLRLGFIPFLLGTAITIVHIPVIIGAVLEGPWVGLVIGTLFGLSSVFWAYVAPTGPGDLYFRNWLIAVLPRLLIGPVAYLAYQLVRKPRVLQAILILVAAVAAVSLAITYGTSILDDAGMDPQIKTLVLWASLVLIALAGLGIALTRGRLGELAAVGTAAVAGTLTNTVLVLGMLGLLSSLAWIDPPLPWGLLLALGLTNGLPEVIAAVLITVAVIAAWKQIEVGRRGARIFQEE